MPHLVVSISGHGFGHVAQTAPILNLLHQRIPQLRMTVRSSVPFSHLRSRIHAPFAYLPSEGDIGMIMSSPLDVCVEESRVAYRTFHAHWEARVAGEARLLRELGADFMVSNVGYLPLAGAQQAGIPNAALCSLNWADIYRHYCGDDAIAAQIYACYAGADTFLRATPGMAMPSLTNLICVAPIASVGRNLRDDLDRQLKLAADEKLVLISLGGVASRLPIERWPRIDGVRWLVQQAWQVDHPDAVVIESLQISFGDLLASSDAFICKPGYGSFVEATCSSVPVLYVNRADWPESPALIEWLQQYGLCREISRHQLEQGDIAESLEAIWEAPTKFGCAKLSQMQYEPAIPEGVAQAVDWLITKLGV